eukprot:TRINITY_DN1694_c0_g1_i1.p1 TRINITY_DN1694_c0_g1~~TRINITY_DN1694_c0_g1_i1.p1  ORF type:complete len:366 (+),score=52.93 TRINITY_DN1694_c0_g1_i1:77-1174(+)
MVCATYLQTATGNVMVGEPIKPAAAYPAQNVPNPYYFQPPVAYYQPTAPPAPQMAAPVQANTGVPPPPYYYGMPSGCIDNYPTNVAAHSVNAYNQSEPYVANTSYEPAAEVTTDLSGHDYTTTDQNLDVNPAVTHLNFHDNKLTKIAALEKFPALMRITLSWNNLKSLQGISGAPYLRWLDASGNYFTDFTGLNVSPALEWLDLTQSDITSFRGLTFAPNLTWLCLHHNRFNNFKGVETMPLLQFLDVSDNEVRDVSGLEKGMNLREINLSNNPMCEGDVKYNVQTVKQLSSLPCLIRLNITDTFYDKEEEDIVAHFKFNAPHVEVVITEERTTQLGHNYKFKGKDCPLYKNNKPKSKGSCCAVA